MRGGVAHQTLQAARHLEQVRHPWIVFLQLAKFRGLLERLFQGNIQGIGNQLGDLVDFGKGDVQARPASRITAFAPMVPKVMIWLTFSRPYFPVT